MLQFALKPRTQNYFSQWENEVENLFDTFNGHTVTAACEIVDGEKAFSVSLDIPGFKKEDVQIEIKDRHLLVSGQRYESKDDKVKTLRQERRFGKFQRAFSLPEGIDEKGVTAKFADGVLEITLPKTEVVTHKIAIN